MATGGAASRQETPRTGSNCQADRAPVDGAAGRARRPSSGATPAGPRAAAAAAAGRAPAAAARPADGRRGTARCRWAPSTGRDCRTAQLVTFQTAGPSDTVSAIRRLPARWKGDHGSRREQMMAEDGRRWVPTRQHARFGMPLKGLSHLNIRFELR